MDSFASDILFLGTDLLQRCADFPRNRALCVAFSRKEARFHGHPPL
jgi:hypothetical protein